MTNAGQLIISCEQGVGFVTLNRPAQHNAICRHMWDEIPRCLEQLKGQGARLVVVTGSGTSFASGADLDELVALHDYEAARRHWHAIRDCLEAIACFPLPTIAMVNGPCLGGGCLLALACDLRIASRHATFSLPVAKLGIVLDDKNIARLVGAVGPAYAKEMLFTGGTIDGARALAAGLVTELVEAAHLRHFVENVAEQIMANAPESVCQAKMSVLRACGASGTQDEDAVVNSYLESQFKLRAGKAGT